jgi:hypothetical protein
VRRVSVKDISRRSRWPRHRHGTIWRIYHVRRRSCMWRHAWRWHWPGRMIFRQIIASTFWWPTIDRWFQVAFQTLWWWRNEASQFHPLWSCRGCLFSYRLKGLRRSVLNIRFLYGSSISERCALEPAIIPRLQIPFLNISIG